VAASGSQTEQSGPAHAHAQTFQTFSTTGTNALMAAVSSKGKYTYLLAEDCVLFVFQTQGAKLEYPVKASARGAPAGACGRGSPRGCAGA
jgi:hypothetical protein